MVRAHGYRYPATRAIKVTAAMEIAIHRMARFGTSGINAIPTGTVRHAAKASCRLRRVFLAPGARHQRSRDVLGQGHHGNHLFWREVAAGNGHKDHCRAKPGEAPDQPGHQHRGAKHPQARQQRDQTGWPS